jgi:hypothetical protein
MGWREPGVPMPPITINKLPTASSKPTNNIKQKKKEVERDERRRKRE